MWADLLNFFKGALSSSPQQDLTQHVSRAWGEPGYLTINLVLAHLELLMRNANVDGILEV